MVITEKSRKEDGTSSDELVFGKVGETEDSILIGPVTGYEETDDEVDGKINGISFMGSFGGRPPKFNDAQEMQEKIIEYFESEASKRTIYTKEGIPISVPHPTITGLSLYIGFADRSSFYNYAEKEEFSYTIKRARAFIENEYEKMLVVNPTGAIFALKNFGWKDTQTLEGGLNNTNRSVTVEYKVGKYEGLGTDGEPLQLEGK